MLGLGQGPASRCPRKQGPTRFPGSKGCRDACTGAAGPWGGAGCMGTWEEGWPGPSPTKDWDRGEAAGPVQARAAETAGLRGGDQSSGVAFSSPATAHVPSSLVRTGVTQLKAGSFLRVPSLHLL